MTNNNHPITPPPELVEQWCYEDGDEIMTSPRWYQRLCAKSARWGADQELDACCEWLTTKAMTKPWETVPRPVLVTALVLELRAARRPKPQSLKEQAPAYSCILELRDRIKALEREVAMTELRAASADARPTVKAPITRDRDETGDYLIIHDVSPSTSSLVERVRQAQGCGNERDARAAIREVAAWLREQYGPIVSGWAMRLEREAER